MTSIYSFTNRRFCAYIAAYARKSSFFVSTLQLLYIMFVLRKHCPVAVRNNVIGIDAISLQMSVDWIFYERFCQSRYPVAGEHRVKIRVRLAKRPVVSPYCCGLAERQRERLFGWRSPGATEAATAAERRHHHHCNDSSDTVRRAAQLYDCAEADGDAAATLNAAGACTLTVGRTQFTKINGSPWLPIVFDLKFSLTPDRLLSSHDRR